MDQGVSYPPAPLGTYTTLFRLIGADMNSTGDQPFVKAFDFNRYIPILVLATNASTAILLATGGIYTGSAKSGSAIVAASQAWTGLNTTTKVVYPAVAAGGQSLLTGNLYLSLTTAMGSAGACDIYIMGVAG